MLFGVIAMIVAGLSWITSGYIMSNAPRANIDIRAQMVIMFCTAFLLMSGIGFACFGLPENTPDNRIVFYSILVAGLFNTLQFVFVTAAMQRGPNGIIWAIAQSGVVIPFLTGIFFFESKAGMVQWIGFSCIILALVVNGLAKNNQNTAYGKWKLLALLSFLVTGLSQTLQNIPSYLKGSDGVPAAWRTCCFYLSLALGPVIVATMTGSRKKLMKNISDSVRKRKVWLYTMLIICTSFIADWAFLYPGMDSLAKAGYGAIAYPLMVGTAIVGFEVYSMVALKERPTAAQLLTMLLCLVGCVVLGITGN